MSDHYDLAVIGGGVLGLAHALYAARQGRRVVVLDRDARSNGASVRDLGVIQVAGQAEGAAWRRAKRSRDVWAEVCAQAGVKIEHEGLAIVARRAEAAAVLESYMATEMAEGCTLYGADDAHALFPEFKTDYKAVFWSPDELRVEARTAAPKIAGWLADAHDVAFRWETVVTAIDGEKISTSRGPIEAGAMVVCAGDDLRSLYGERLAGAGLTRCKAQRLRVRYEDGFDLPGAVMSDLSLIRQPGFAARPEAEALRARLEAERPEHMQHRVEMIVAQSSDGSLAVGDSRHYDATPDPFQVQAVDELILDELTAVFGKRPKQILSRWIATYAVAKDRAVLTEAPAGNVRVVAASGAGASAAFGIAEETIAGLFG